jgi:hypothetical protein
MAVSQLPQAPYRQDRRIYPTPIIGDVLFSEVRDCTRSEIPEYGTLHPNPKKWPDHKLVYVKPVDIERDGIFEFFYAADRENQDLYNFSSGYRNIVGNAGGREFRVVQRSYVTPRADFQPLDIPFGTPMSDVPEGKFDDIEYVFFDRQQQPIDQQELNSLYVAEVHTYVEKAFLDDKLSYTAQRTDPLPEKFQILVPEQVVEQIVEGTVEMPTLTGSELSVKEDQLNPDVKLVRTSTRDRSSLPVSLDQKATTNDKQLASITQTVQSGDTVEQPSATVDIQSEALGDGSYVVTKTEVPELFTAESYASEIPDRIPEKFRAFVPTTTEEASEIGTAEPPTLETGELSKSEQQQNKFVKRKRTTKRDATVLPKQLTQKATNSVKQVATIIETLQVGDSAEPASATVDIDSEALGDGTYVVRKTQVPSIFKDEVYSVEKQDNVPEKFKAEPQYKTITQSINKVGSASPPSLATGEISRTHQQVNEFVYKEQVVKRDNVTNVALPQVQRAYVEGTVAKVDEKLSTSSTIESGLLVSESAATPIGDGKFVVQTVKVDSWPQLKSSEWDSELNTQIQKTEQFVSPPTSFTEANTSYRAINKDRSLKITEAEPTTALTNYVMSFPVQVDVPLPDVLKSISVVWAEEIATGKTDTDWDGAASGTSWSLSGSENASAESSASIKPELVMDIQRPWGSNISATAHYFYIKGVNNIISESSFLSKLTTVAGAPVQRWPSFAPVSHTLVLTGGNASVQAKVSWSASKTYSESNNAYDKNVGKGDSYSVGTSLNAVTIPPTIHGPIIIWGAEKKEKNVTSQVISGTGATINFPYVTVTQSALHKLTADVTPKTLAATTPSEIPKTGLYVVQSQVVPYKWGWARCSAVVFNATIFA